MHLSSILNGNMNRFNGVISRTFSNESVESRTSNNSSYADLLETSDVVIRERYEGSVQGLPFGCNIVTSNLLKCKRKMIHPYYKMLTLIGWKPFAANAVRFQCFWSFVNFVYPIFITLLLMVWYVARVWTCQGRLSLITASKTTPMPTLLPPTHIIPTSNTSNWTNLMPAHNKKTNESILQPSDGKPSNCEHLFGDYILPDLLYFISFLLGFYIFRIQESEGFYALMEKVYLQSTNPQRITRTLRFYLYLGIFWLLCSAGLSIFFHHVFGMHVTTGIENKHPFMQYTFAATLVIAECAANCVVISVIISHSGQCQLLKYYLEGIMNRLEEKSTELRYIMKDILDVRQNLARINGLLAVNAACVVFNISVMTLVGFIVLLTNQINARDLWIYRATFVILWSSIFAFSIIQPARLTACGGKLKDKSLVIRVFGYHTHTQLDIDSFLTFVNLVDLEAKLFTIPVKAPYIWGVLVLSTQILIIVAQMGLLVPDNVWF